MGANTSRVDPGVGPAHDGGGPSGGGGGAAPGGELSTWSRFSRRRGPAPTAPISCPSNFAPTWTIPEYTALITDANFVACRHTRSDPCLSHAGIGPCACEAVQRPTMSQDQAWTAMSLRCKAVHDAWRNELPPLRVPCAPLSIGAPHARRSSSSPLDDSRAPILAAAAARRSCPTRLVCLPLSKGHQPSVLAVLSRVVKESAATPGPTRVWRHPGQESVVAHAHAARKEGVVFWETSTPCGSCSCIASVGVIGARVYMSKGLSRRESSLPLSSTQPTGVQLGRQMQGYLEKGIQNSHGARPVH